MNVVTARQDRLYAEAMLAISPAIRRLARATEANSDGARDLEQDIHLALWRSFENFDGRCSLSTWCYRVAHNVAADHISRARRRGPAVSLDEVELTDLDDPAAMFDDARIRAKLHSLIQLLRQPDRSVILLYLEALDAKTIAAITGLSGANVAVKIHRIKALLASQFQEAM
jgi:RNA polymerase sigma-70 factor, ECF subfamily